MPKSFLLLVLLVSFVQPSFATSNPSAPAKLRYPSECVLKLVARKLNVILKAEIVVPQIRFESQITLQEFQDAIEPWWGFRPNVVTNAFIPTRNEIYLIDDARYYEKHQRAIDDSLAHEFTHFIQVRYIGVDLQQGDDSVEAQAVDVQTWFRETYIQSNKDVRETCSALD